MAAISTGMLHRIKIFKKMLDDHQRIIPVKFGGIQTCSIGGDTVKSKIVV